MLKIRLQRAGKKNQPYFKIVVTESKNAPKSGRFLEIVGSYDIRKNNAKLKEDRIKYWLSQGVQLSGTAHNLFVDAKIIKGPKINVSPSEKKKEKSREKPEEKAEKEKIKEKSEKKVEEKPEETTKEEKADSK
ncbi:MAG: 30S ribosomal protein S16 [Candidatus Niyogibacteria bacterium]|nr:30S ribosomal protein S16 [Candidatus Niyogibacteria bacterium]